MAITFWASVIDEGRIAESPLAKFPIIKSKSQFPSAAARLRARYRANSYARGAILRAPISSSKINVSHTTYQFIRNSPYGYRPHHCARRAPAQPQEHQRRDSPQPLTVITGLSGSGKSRWRSTRSTPRASGVTSNRSRLTRASSSTSWKSRTSIRSRAYRPRSRSSRRPPAAARARRSARSPRSTIICGCSSPPSASRIAPTAGARSRARRPSRSFSTSGHCPKASAS